MLNLDKIQQEIASLPLDAQKTILELVDVLNFIPLLAFIALGDF